MTTITLTTPQIEELRKIAKDALRNECCAFLLGHHNGDGKVAIILGMRNVYESPSSFSIDPAEFLTAYTLS